MSQASIVSFMRDIDPVLDNSYRCVQDILAAIRLYNTDVLLVIEISITTRKE